MCQDCQHRIFYINQEVSGDDDVTAFHTSCAHCGKRGYLEQRVVTTTLRKFVQFAEVHGADYGADIRDYVKVSSTTSTSARHP